MPMIISVVIKIISNMIMRIIVKIINNTIIPNINPATQIFDGRFFSSAAIFNYASTPDFSTGLNILRDAQ